MNTFPRRGLYYVLVLAGASLLALRLSHTALRLGDYQSSADTFFQTARPHQLLSENSNSTSFLPQWMKDYFAWHNQQLLQITPENWQQHRFLVMTCLADAAHCGGTSDRLRNTIVTLRIAADTKRILLIHWEKPAPLEAFLLPPANSGLDWRTPDWLVPHVQRNPAHAKILPSLENHCASETQLVTTTLQMSSVHAEWYYNTKAERDSGGGNAQDAQSVGAYQLHYHEFWYALFTPVPAIADRIQSELDRMHLEPGSYSSVHLRANYAMEKSMGGTGREEHLIQKWTANAIDCASHLRPGGPFFFAADSKYARQLARDYGTKRGVSVQTTSVDEEEPLHLDKVQDWQNRSVSDFYSIFVDLYLLSLGECLSYNVGGFGLWAHAISHGKAACRIRHWTEGVPEDEAAVDGCGWLAPAVDTKVPSIRSAPDPLFLPPRDPRESNSSSVDVGHVSAEVTVDLSQGARPNLVLHLGPPKTATTTLQAELSRLDEVLAKDNYVYLGAWLDDEGNRREPTVLLRQPACHSEMHAARREYEASTQQVAGQATLKDRLLQLPCASAIVEELDTYRSQGQSIILSDETLSFRWQQFDGIPLGAPFDWISLAALLSDDWDVSIVAGYRRYADWITSVHEQRERWTPRKRVKNKWTTDGGDAVQPIFPNYVQGGPDSHAAGQHFMFTHELLTSVNGVFEAQILNMHQESSIRTTFLCDCLPDAGQACAWSREGDRTTEEVRANRNAHTLFYDALGVAAVEAGLLDASKHSRHSVALTIEEFQTGLELPLTCPTDEELQDFLSSSLDLEERIAAHNVDFTTSPTEHRAHFDDLVNRKAFCWINTAAVLQEEPWRTFFADLSETT